jgi:hypothetical protein
MTQQTQPPRTATPTIAPLRTLAELDENEAMRQTVETDLTPQSPFAVHPGWYERYWYGDRPPSRWGTLASTVRRYCCDVPRVGDTICHAIARTMTVFARHTGAAPKADCERGRAFSR